MNFKQWLLSEEVYPNKNATVFHRTKNRENVENIFKSSFRTSGSGLYGDGLYTTFSLESQFNSYMNVYGDILIKFKVTDLDKYLIFQPNVAKYVFGKDNYTIEKQLQKLNINAEDVNINELTLNPFKWFNQKPQNTQTELPQNTQTELPKNTGISVYDKKLNTDKFSDKVAEEFYKKNPWITQKLHGIIYSSPMDGDCLVKYKPIENAITMIGYVNAPVQSSKEKISQLHNNTGWITSASVTNIKDSSKLKSNKSLQKYKDISQPIQDILFKAAKEGDLDLFKIYFSKVNSSDISMILGKLIYIAADNSKSEIVKYIFSQQDPKLLINLNDYQNSSFVVNALVKAAEKNDINMIKIILDGGHVKLKLEYIDFILKKTNNQSIVDYLNSYKV